MAARVRAWLFDGALPLWAEVGVDRETGGFVDWLEPNGAPARGADKRLRVQARQIYLFAHAAALGWTGPGLATAAAGYDFMTRHFWHPDGGWIFSVDQWGRPRDRTRATYEQAFAVLALAWYHRASGEVRALQWAERTLAFLDRALFDGTGYRRSIPDQPERLQNPHMHLFEAMLALYQAAGDPTHLARAGRLAELLGDRLFDARTGTLGEVFAADWSARADRAGDAPGDAVEPGHHFEWVWLLHEYVRLGGTVPVRTMADRLYRFACRHGTDRADGLVFDAVSRDGRPIRDGKRLWPQTEALKAHLAAGEPARAEAICAALFEHYLCRGPGLWREHPSPAGTDIVDRVPASSLYHLFVALTEYLRVTADPSANGT